MDAAVRSERRRPLGPTVVAGTLAVLATAVMVGGGAKHVAPFAILVALVAIGATRAYQALLQWRTLVSAVLVVIFFIPIKRYAVPGHLPFDLEPYRIVVALVVGCWITSLLIDRNVRLRGSVLDAPLAVIFLAVLCSDIFNGQRMSDVGMTVPKALTFFVSYLLVYYLLVSVAHTPESVERLVRLIVTCGGLVALAAFVESRMNYNVFDHLGGVIPGLVYRNFNDTALSSVELARGGRLRVYASAQHPIALAALFVMLMPLAIYLVHKTRRIRWWLVLLLLTVGVMATQSRTGIIMIVVVVVVYLWLRPRETKRLWPALIPMMVAVQIALPHTFANIRGAFFPKGGIVAEQAHEFRPGDLKAGHGRLATLGPTFAQVSEEPFFGIGYGTRITAGPGINAYVLDNAWLGTLLEIGVVGAIGWIWVFGRTVRRLGRVAKSDDSDRGWLMAGLAASIASFAIGMLTYDAFSFIQVTFISFILLGLSAALLRPVPVEIPAWLTDEPPARPPLTVRIARRLVAFRRWVLSLPQGVLTLMRTLAAVVRWVVAVPRLLLRALWRLVVWIVCLPYLLARAAWRGVVRVVRVGGLAGAWVVHLPLVVARASWLGGVRVAAAAADLLEVLRRLLDRLLGLTHALAGAAWRGALAAAAAASRAAAFARPHALPVAAAASSVAAVTFALAAARSSLEVGSLAVVYVLPVLLVARWFGRRFAAAVSAASIGVFNWLFLEPAHTFGLHRGATWVTLGVYLATAALAGGRRADTGRRG